MIDDKVKYKIPAICSNCGYSGSVSIPKEQRITDGQCPHCGCCALSRDTTQEAKYVTAEEPKKEEINRDELLKHAKEIMEDQLPIEAEEDAKFKRTDVKEKESEEEEAYKQKKKEEEGEAEDET